jgi:hypothetical protein
LSFELGLEESYGKPMATEGQGGSIPLCHVFQKTFPDAEIVLYALFLRKYGESGR